MLQFSKFFVIKFTYEYTYIKNILHSTSFTTKIRDT